MANQTPQDTVGDLVDKANYTDLLNNLIDKGRIARLPENDNEQEQKVRSHVQEMINALLRNASNIAKDKREIQDAINRYVSELDKRISAQLAEIMHDPNFQEMEARWRGLRHLVMKAETGESLKIRVLNVSREQLKADLNDAVEFDQSALFKKVYENEYGTFGGNPYSMLVGDLTFGRHPTEDFQFLGKLAEVAAAAHAPLIASADPGLFDLESYEDLATPRDLAKIFESVELAPWKSFRESEDSRYVSLTMPRVLMRLPYGKDTMRAEGFEYEEGVNGRDHKAYLWGNPAYVLAERIANAFSLYGWTAAIRGVEGGGKLEGLPNHVFDTLEGDRAMKCPTEVSITDRRENELNNLGFISIVHKKNHDYAAIFGGATVNKPKQYLTHDANANAKLSSMLPYMLNASRFAHYVKVLMRDKIGSFMTEDNVRDYLTVWMSQYVLGKDDAGQSIKAKYPLREARVDVKPIPGRPGAYDAVLFLRPHFQLEELSTSIRLVAELPPPSA